MKPEQIEAARKLLAARDRKQQADAQAYAADEAYRQAEDSYLKEFSTTATAPFNVVVGGVAIIAADEWWDMKRGRIEYHTVEVAS